MKMIGICGKIGSGKDTVADYLVDSYGFEKIVMGEIVSKELDKKNIDNNRENLQKLSELYKEEFGSDIWAEKTLEYAREKGLDKVVVSGVRESKEVDIFREVDFSLLCVKADKEERFRRIKGRGSSKDVSTMEEFEDQEEKEAEIFDLYENCEEFSDYVIENNGDIEDLHDKVDELIQKI